MPGELEQGGGQAFGFAGHAVSSTGRPAVVAARLARGLDVEVGDGPQPPAGLGVPGTVAPAATAGAAAAGVSRATAAPRRRARLVGGVLPRGAEPGDDGGVAAADDQRVAGGELADHVRRHHVVPDRGARGSRRAAAAVRSVKAAWPHSSAGHLQGGGVGDAGQPDLDPGGVQDDLGAVLAPPGAQLRLAVRDGDDLDALAAGVGQPGGSGTGQIWTTSSSAISSGGSSRPPGDGLPELGGDVVDLAGQAANSGATGLSSCSDSAIRYSVPRLGAGTPRCRTRRLAAGQDGLRPAPGRP